ncbi:hypothetical protein [Halostagnicola kamekurae]|uniref:hypothetical protein n=1 Tax=Halostagnicola kamekurae TaxID=619731 RepID=UPI0011142843|nr:hypothetical protein [Halostagnicola kamekurae]
MSDQDRSIKDQGREQASTGSRPSHNSEDDALNRRGVEYIFETPQEVSGKSSIAQFEKWTWTRLEYLARSPRRIRILRYLRNNSEQRETISEDLDIPQSTLIRTLKEMTEYGWITKVSSGEYTVTSMGSAIADMFGDFYMRFEVVASLSQLHKLLPEELMEQNPFSKDDLGIINPSDIITCIATPDSPYAPMQRFAEKFRTADVNNIFLGVSNPLYYNLISKSINNNSSIKLFIPREVGRDIFKGNRLNQPLFNNSISVSFTGNKFQYCGLTTDDSLLIEGLNKDMKSQIVVELPRTYDTVEDWTSYIISHLEEKSTSVENIN